MKQLYILLTCIVCCCLTYGQIPKTLSYSGALLQKSGDISRNGGYTLQFSLFDQEKDGKPVWTETQKNVDVSGGSFNVVLGSVTPLDLSFNTKMYMELTVLSGPGVASPETFSPRSELTSSPYSLAPWEAKDRNIFYSSGKVGIGTDTPTEQLDVNGTVKANAFIGDGSSLTGITGATGGVSNTGSTTIAADNQKSGEGEISFRTGDKEQMKIGNAGDVTITKTLTIMGGDDGSVNTGNFKADASTQRLGVGGATMPIKTLDVGGEVRIRTLNQASSATNFVVADANGNLYRGNTSITSIGGSGTLNYIPKWTNATTLGNSHLFDNGTAVGIGTTSPTLTSMLDVVKGSASPPYTIAFAIQGRSHTDHGILGQSDGVQKWGIIAKNTTGNKTEADFGGDTYAGIMYGGNVGIGTKSPVASLDLIGTIKITDGSQGLNKVLTSDANGLASWKSFGLNLWTSNNNNLYPTTLSNSVGIGTPTPSGIFQVSESFSPVNTPAMANFTLGTALAIKDAAVSIAMTHSVKHGLTIKTDNSTTGDVNHASLWIENIGLGGYRFYAAGPSTNLTPFVIANNGNVGIGTNNPWYNLDIAPTNLFSTYARVNRGSTAASGGYIFATGGSDNWYFFQPSLMNTNNLWLVSNSNTSIPVVAFDYANLRVGVNTTTPRSELDVTGTGAIVVPVGTTAQRPGSPAKGMIRFNTTINKFEGYDGTNWVPFY